MNKGSRLFYGWWMVILVTIFFIMGNAAPFTIVLKQLMEKFHTGRGEVSLSYLINWVAAGVTGIFVGRTLPHYSPKRFILWGSVVGGISALALSLANNLWFLHAFSFIIGVAGGFSNAVAMYTL